MPTVVTDLQRKYRYKVTFVTNHDGTPFSDVPVDEFTPPDRRREPVTRQNRSLGQITLIGPPAFGEMTLRMALRITSDDSSNSTAALLDALQSLHENDADTCDVVLMTLADVAGAEQIAYKHAYHNCRVTSYKIESLNRRGDDDMLHVEVMLIPSSVETIKGDQI